MSGASTSSASDPVSDQIFAIMQSEKVEDCQGKFVWDTRPSPEPAFDPVRFCTIPDDFTILTVDPTFNLGDFDVTPTSYRHLSLEERSLGQPFCLHWTYNDTLPQDISYLPVLFVYTSRASSWVRSTPSIRNRWWESTVRCFFAWISLCHSPHLFYPLPSKHQKGAARTRLLGNSEDRNPEGYLWTQRWKHILWGTSGQHGSMKTILIQS